MTDRIDRRTPADAVPYSLSAWRAGAAAALALLLSAPVVHGEEPPPQLAKSIQMNFKDTPLETVLEQLSEMGGLVVVKDMVVEGRITIISKQPMNVDEAVSLLNSVLKEKGYVGIRTGRVLKLVKIDEAKKRNIPVRMGADPAKVEPGDDVITQVIPIKFIDVQQLKKDLTPLVPTYADLSSNASSNTLILTDTTANIRRILEIVKAMDTQSTTISEVKVFQLKYANADGAARLINDIFKDDEQQNQQQRGGFGRGGFQQFGGGRGFGPGGFGPGGGGGGGQAQQTPDGPDQQAQRLRRVSASADDRTNAVVVSASADTMPIIAQVIKDLDSNPAEEQSVFIYHLKNAQAINLEYVVNTLFGTGTGSSSRTGATQRGTAQGVGQDVARAGTANRTGTTNRGGGTNNQGGGVRTTQQGGFNQGAGGQNGGGGNNAGGQGISGDLTGQVFVVADLDTNSLIVLTASKNFDRVKAILCDLDKPVPQVLIKVLIAEVTHTNTKDIGVDTSILTDGALQSLTQNFGVATATGGLIARVVQDDVTVTLRALEERGKLEILSRPYILASDNQLSSITVGQEVPFVISSRTTETGQTINTIQYQDIGILLNVTAHINEDGLVIMDVAPEVSSITGDTVPISENVEAPVFAKRAAQSRVGVKDGQTVVIGGLMEDRKTDSVRGIPLLNKIPGLGTLFRRKQTSKGKTELLIFLTPHVAQKPDILEPRTESEKETLKLVPDAIKRGTFQEHLDGLKKQGEIVPLDTPETIIIHETAPAPLQGPQPEPKK